MTEALHGDERRVSPRRRLDADVCLLTCRASLSQPTWGSCGDLSRGGLFVWTTRSLPAGELVTIRIVPLQGDALLATGVVVHCTRAAPSPGGGGMSTGEGIGCRFVSLAAATRRWLCSTLGEMPRGTLDEIPGEVVAPVTACRADPTGPQAPAASIACGG